MRIRDNIVRMYSMMTGQTQEQITLVREMLICPVLGNCHVLASPRSRTYFEARTFLPVRTVLIRVKPVG